MRADGLFQWSIFKKMQQKEKQQQQKRELKCAYRKTKRGRNLVMSELCRGAAAVTACRLSAFVRFIQLTEYLQTAQRRRRRKWPDVLWQTDKEVHSSVGHLAPQDYNPPETVGASEAS